MSSPEIFYRKFANLPISERSEVHSIEGFAYTPLRVYRLLNLAIERKNEAIKEVERLLKIGEIILH